jgi:nicotinamide mononucleotide transporter
MDGIALRRLWGTREDHLEQARVAAAMLLVTVVYEMLSLHLNADARFNIFEVAGTWTGLVCVWLSRTRNILCWPWGVVSSLALGFFFGTIGLPGQQWLNWIYFGVIQLWAWPHWAFGGAERTELAVTTLTTAGRLVMIACAVGGSILVYKIIDVFAPGSVHPWLDAIVVASSVVAQFLLGKKKVESWVLWLGPVNALSIVLFYSAGAYMVTALYVAFFVHAVFGLTGWARATTST